MKKWFKRLQFLYWGWYWKTYSKNWDTDKVIAFLDKHHFVDENLTPKICMNCGHTKFIEIPTKYRDGQVCAANIACKSCQQIVGSWFIEQRSDLTEKV